MNLRKLARTTGPAVAMGAIVLALTFGSSTPAGVADDPPPPTPPTTTTNGNGWGHG